MRKLAFLILIIEFTAACGGGGGGGGGGRRQNPVGGTTPTPTPAVSPYGGTLRATAGTVTSSATGIAMKASVSAGNTRVVTSASGVAAEISVGAPASR